ncbi:MAG: hypothetical protein HYS59_01050 [Candidatus Vogelbacteria bacterium]|nr:hypothetical protein [Candidatus Vogelbacteria bacterium]
MNSERWKYVLLVFLGFWTSALPFLGFPRGLKNGLFVLTGFVVVVLSFLAEKACHSIQPPSLFESRERDSV